MQKAAYFETFLKALLSDKQIPGFINHNLFDHNGDVIMGSHCGKV